MEHNFKIVKMSSTFVNLALLINVERVASPFLEGELKRALATKQLWFRFTCPLILACAAGKALAQTIPAAPTLGAASIERAVDQVRVPPSIRSEFDYIMTARVRLLLFWVGKDDVGGGYIRLGTSPQDGSLEVINLLIGSDPAKAPRAINRWGLASEIFHKSPESSGGFDTSVFFGFMKVSSGTSVAEMQKELAKEKQSGNFLFSAILNQAGPDENFAKTVPFASSTDFTIHDLERAEPVVLEHLMNSEGRLRTADAGEFQACHRTEGFLSSVSELVDAALSGRPAPVSNCYLYNGQRFTLKLKQTTRVPRRGIHITLRDVPHDYARTYHDLLLASFDNFNETTKTGGSFDLLLGTSGALRGAPVQITYQPNWWFQVILNLKTPSESETAQTD
jgi:hypothetical protein